MRIYIKESFEKSIDGEKLKTTTTYEEKPDKYDYSIWMGARA